MNFKILENVDKNSPGIYFIKNLENDKFYLGSSRREKYSLVTRYREHKHNLNHNKHCNPHLQHAYNQKLNNFEFICIMNCAADKVLVLEQYFLDTLKPFDPKIGYNILNSTVNFYKPRDLNFNPRKSKEKKTYRVLNPNNEIVEIRNLKLFCKDKGLNYQGMARMLTPSSKISNFLGWRKYLDFIPKEKAKIKYRASYRSFDLISPNGSRHQGENLKQFCIDFNLNYREIYKVILGIKLYSKGWITYENHQKGIKPKLAGFHVAKYDLISPEGKRFIGENREKFCREMGLRLTMATDLMIGNDLSYRGWKKYKEKI